MKKGLYSVLAAGFVLAVWFLYRQVTEPVASDGYRAGLETWQENRIRSLKRDQGWLTLTDLIWLKEGSRPVAGFGTFSAEPGNVTFQADRDAGVTLNGIPFAGGVLKPDTVKGGPDRLVSGSRTLAVIIRGGKPGLRIWDTEAPARKTFTGIDRFPADESWVIEGRWQPYPKPQTVKIPTVIPGLTEEAKAFGQVVFTRDGTEFSLEPTSDDSLTYLSFVFADETTGKETYGGGRFLEADRPSNGKVLLDFNKAYNPPCAFTPFATCPVPLAKNRLPVAVTAGEKKAGHH